MVCQSERSARAGLAGGDESKRRLIICFFSFNQARILLALCPIKARLMRHLRHDVFRNRRNRQRWIDPWIGRNHRAIAHIGILITEQPTLSVNHTRTGILAHDRAAENMRG